jgi:hypothetical protein
MNKLPISAVGECDTCGWTRVSDFDQYDNDIDSKVLDASCDTCANTVTIYVEDLDPRTTEWEPRPKLEFYSAIYGNKLEEV